jgi:hypothetical protein
LGSTATPAFEMSVHGVVVQISNDAPTRSPSAASVTGNRMKMLGSSTVSYPRATSASDNAVPHRGQYAVTLSASTSRPRSCRRLSDHHTDSM